MFIFNEPHANEMENVTQKSQPPETLAGRAQRLGLSELPWSPEQTGGLRGPEMGCAHPHQGVRSRDQDKLQRPCCCGEREGFFWEGTTVPVDGVLEGRGCLPGQMVSLLPALEAKWILMKSQPWC